jgi:hypothetical protein
MNRAICILPFVLACGARANDAGVEQSQSRPQPRVSWAEQRLRADRLVSVFENGTPEIQYAYVEDIADGRGFTCGRGFTTRTGDVARVVNDYVAIAPNDALAAYAGALDALANSDSGDTSTLRGFPDAWRAAAERASFRAAQDAEVERSSLPRRRMPTRSGS